MSTQYEKEMIRMLDRIVKNLETLNQTLKMRTNMEVGLISAEDILPKIPFAKKSVEMMEEESGIE